MFADAPQYILQAAQNEYRSIDERGENGQTDLIWANVDMMKYVRRKCFWFFEITDEKCLSNSVAACIVCHLEIIRHACHVQMNGI